VPVKKKDEAKSKAELIRELEALRQRVRQLEALKNEHQGLEQSLTQKEAMYRGLFDNMSGGVAVYEAVNDGQDFIFKDFNKAGEEIENTKRETLLGRKVTEVFPGVTEFGLFEVFQRVWRTGIPELHPVSLYKDNRLMGWRENYVYKLPTGEIVAVYNDVTERKIAEEKIKASLKEKELLLKEIHHRVKNNMAVISSLLGLQADTFDDPRFVKALKNSQNRIRSMVLVHEKLYKAGDFSRIDFADYTRGLVGHIAQFSNMKKHTVSVAIEAGDILLGIDLSIPCGLIINELVTNAFKHAFPQDQDGKIDIRMQRIKQDKFYRLMVSDNGVGLPPHIDINSTTSFGLHLVNLLTQQLGGTLEIEREKGTAINITFPALTRG